MDVSFLIYSEHEFMLIDDFWKITFLGNRWIFEKIYIIRLIFVKIKQIYRRENKMDGFSRFKKKNILIFSKLIFN